MEIKNSTLRIYTSSERGSQGGPISPLHTGLRGSTKEIQTFLGSEDAFLGSVFTRGFYLKNVSTVPLRNIQFHVSGGKLVVPQEYPRFDNPLDFDIIAPEIPAKNSEDLFWNLYNTYGSTPYRVFFARFLERIQPFLPLLEGERYDYIDYTSRTFPVTPEELEFYKEIYPEKTTEELTVLAQAEQRDFQKFRKWFYLEVLSTANSRASVFGQIQPSLGFYNGNVLPAFGVNGVSPLGEDVKVGLESKLEVLRAREYSPFVFFVTANFNPFWSLDRDLSFFWFSWEEKVGNAWVPFRSPSYRILTRTNFGIITEYNQSALESVYDFYPPFFRYYDD